MLKMIALWLILMFSKDRGSFLTKKTVAIIDIMKENELFRSESEFVYQILEVFNGYLTLESLNKLSGKTYSIHSIITRETWEEIFPKVVVYVDNKIIFN